MSVCRGTQNSSVPTCYDSYRVWQKEQWTDRMETCFLDLAPLSKMSFVSVVSSLSGLDFPLAKSRFDVEDPQGHVSS